MIRDIILTIYDKFVHIFGEIDILILSRERDGGVRRWKNKS